MFQAEKSASRGGIKGNRLNVKWLEPRKNPGWGATVIKQERKAVAKLCDLKTECGV